jgi:hypothetical protein
VKLTQNTPHRSFPSARRHVTGTPSLAVHAHWVLLGAKLWAGAAGTGIRPGESEITHANAQPIGLAGNVDRLMSLQGFNYTHLS